MPWLSAPPGLSHSWYRRSLPRLGFKPLLVSGTEMSPANAVFLTAYEKNGLKGRHFTLTRLGKVLVGDMLHVRFCIEREGWSIRWRHVQPRFVASRS